MVNISEVHDVDIEGMETLNVVSEADRYNRWVYDAIKPFCPGEILEIGSGIGNISSFFIKDNRRISLSDLRGNYISILQEQFGKLSNVQDIFQMNIIDPEFNQKFAGQFNAYDSIYALNIIEHVEDDVQAIENCKKLLKPGGYLVILVPAYQFLYNAFDEGLMHYRRYTVKSLKEIMTQNEFGIIHHQYFNLAGILGWWISGSLLNKKIIPAGQMKFYNALVPLFKFIDTITLNKIGLSAICVGKKR